MYLEPVLSDFRIQSTQKFRNIDTPNIHTRLNLLDTSTQLLNIDTIGNSNLKFTR